MSRIKLEDTGLSINDFNISINFGTKYYNQDIQIKYFMCQLSINNEFVPWINNINIINPTSQNILYEDIPTEVKLKAIDWYINTNNIFIRKIKLNKINL